MDFYAVCHTCRVAFIPSLRRRESHSPLCACKIRPKKGAPISVPVTTLYAYRTLVLRILPQSSEPYVRADAVQMTYVEVLDDCCSR
jgi:hypothetical protein